MVIAQLKRTNNNQQPSTDLTVQHEILSQSTDIQAFDYDVLDPETQAVLRECLIKYWKTNNNKKLIIGEIIVCAKERLARGQFIRWVKSELGISRTQAFNYENVYKVFRNCSNFEQLKIHDAASYLLASPSTPDSAREEAIKRATQKETISHELAKEIVQRHKQILSNTAETVTSKISSEVVSCANETTTVDSYASITSEFEKGAFEQEIERDSSFEVERSNKSSENFQLQPPEMNLCKSGQASTEMLISDPCLYKPIKACPDLPSFNVSHSDEKLVFANAEYKQYSDETNQSLPIYMTSDPDTNFSSELKRNELENIAKVLDQVLNTIARPTSIEFFQFMSDEMLERCVNHLESLFVRAKDAKNKRLAA